MQIPLEPGRFDAVILDLDGTMVDTMGDFDAAIGAMLAQLALPPLPRESLAHFVGNGSEHLVRSALGHVVDACRATALYAEAYEAYQAHYGHINGQHSALYPGVADGLTGLRSRGLPLACLTNKPVAYARALLAAKGIEAVFSHVFGGDSFERKKPDPLPVLRTCEALGSAPARTLVVGDSSNDARAARGAGCRVVLVTYGYNHGEPVRGVDADAWIDSLAELVAS
ncbi:MAG: phosphoglycolate phosphatase [Burkholderiaceae bacterium]|nr:phosphoglycolate phosphatase [Burkholderiaceae bacterium]